MKNMKTTLAEVSGEKRKKKQKKKHFSYPYL